MKSSTPGYAKHRQHRFVALALVAAIGAMVGLSYAAVPLYAMFCKATGFGGTTQVADHVPSLQGHRQLTVRFDANVAPGLPWSFEPEISSIVLRTGETATVYFKVVNRSGSEMAANAVYNVSPDVMGAYFDKIACFCFEEQKVGPGASIDMPVVFFLDPALERDETLNDVETVTLSYTFYPSKSSKKPVSTTLEGDRQYERPRL